MDQHAVKAGGEEGTVGRAGTAVPVPLPPQSELFGTITIENPEEDAAAAAAAEEAKKLEAPVVDPAVVEAQRVASEAQRSAEESRQTSERVLEAVLQGSKASADPDPGDAGVMPDPATDPDGFREWHTKDVAHRDWGHRQETLKIQSAQDDRDTRDRLWQEFSTEHPEWADKPEMAQEAFMLETGGQLPADHAGLKRRVHDRLEGLKKMFGGETPAPNDPAPRTAGISAVTPPVSETHQPAPKREAAGPSLGALSQDISDWQQKSGFF